MDKDTILDYVTETPGNTNRAVLGSMLDSMSGAGLPEVTADDNGDVLTVVEGEWAKASPSGGGGDNVMLVTITEYEEDGDYTYTADTNANDILKALASGKYVYAKCASKYCNLVDASGTADVPGDKTVVFDRVTLNNSGLALVAYRLERKYTSLTDYTDSVTSYGAVAPEDSN